MTAIWSRRNFLSIAALTTLAVAVPVAAVKAGGRVVNGKITGILIDGRSFAISTAADLTRVFGKGSEVTRIAKKLFDD